MTPPAAQAVRRERDLSFERLYERHRPAVYGLLLRDLRNPEEAEDVTQVTFLNAYRALRRGDAPESPRAWLLTIARNACRRRFRTLAARPQEVELDPELVGSSLDYDGPSAAEIRAALRRLKPSHRAVVFLREFWGFSYDEIAEQLGLSHSAVETLLFRARRRLREELEAGEARPERRRLRGVLALPLPVGLGNAFDSLVFTLGRTGVAVRAAGAGLIAAAAVGTGVAVEVGGAEPAPPRAAIDVGAGVSTVSTDELSLHRSAAARAASVTAGADTDARRGRSDRPKRQASVEVGPLGSVEAPSLSTPAVGAESLTEALPEADLSPLQLPGVDEDTVTLPEVGLPLPPLDEDALPSEEEELTSGVDVPLP